MQGGTGIYLSACVKVNGLCRRFLFNNWTKLSCNFTLENRSGLQPAKTKKLQLLYRFFCDFSLTTTLTKDNFITK
jgi:hypothetical protein